MPQSPPGDDGAGNVPLATTRYHDPGGTHRLALPDRQPLTEAWKVADESGVQGDGSAATKVAPEELMLTTSRASPSPSASGTTTLNASTSIPDSRGAMRPQRGWPRVSGTMPVPACPLTQGEFDDSPHSSPSSPAPGGHAGTQLLEHATAATLTQKRSHDCEQQDGSTAHTALQQVASLQAGVGWGCVHEPAPGSPHDPLPPPQSAVAPRTQELSHVTWQQ